MSKSSRSPEVLAWISIGLSLLVFLLTLIIGVSYQISALVSVGWLVLSSLLIWLVLALQFRQLAMAEREKLDMRQLAQDDQASTIFQSGDDRANLLAVNQKRLEVFEKWFLPLFSLLIGIYQLTMGVVLISGVEKEWAVDGRNVLIAAVVATGVAFVSFLMSRYATGMSCEERWRPLRAGGSSFLAVAILCFLLAVGLGVAFLGKPVIAQASAWIVPGLMILLGVETLANLIMDIYRPRVAGQYNRVAIDSRILGVINEPGGVFHSMAAAIDYQFGFQVSQTWFYKLLEKAILPLLLFGGLTLYLMSSIVVITTGEQAIVERFGNPLDGNKEVRHWKPGLHLKWPWPIDKVYRYPTAEIDVVYVGYRPEAEEDDADSEHFKLPKPLLWGEGHYAEEEPVLVASEYGRRQNSEQAPPVGILNANIPVHYRVKNLYDFLYNNAEPKKLMESICYNELAKFAASSLVEVTDASSGRVSLLGAGRVEAGRILRERIQAVADAQGLGLEVVFLGVQGIHPPADSEVAKKYQEVVGAIQQRQTEILAAQAEYNSRLSELAGSVGTATKLFDLSSEYQAVRAQSQSGDAPDEARRLDAAMGEAKGEIFAILRSAQADAYEKPALAKARGERFSGQVKAYAAAPTVYPYDLRLKAMTKVLPGLRKYLLLNDPNDREVFILNLEEKLSTDVYDVSVFESETDTP